MVRAILKLDVQMQTAEIMVESFRVVKFNNQKRASDRERNLLLILCVHCNIRQMLIHVIGMAFFMYEKTGNSISSKDAFNPFITALVFTFCTF